MMVRVLLPVLKSESSIHPRCISTQMMDGGSLPLTSQLCNSGEQINVTRIKETLTNRRMQMMSAVRITTTVMTVFDLELLLSPAQVYLLLILLKINGGGKRNSIS